MLRPRHPGRSGVRRGAQVARSGVRTGAQVVRSGVRSGAQAPPEQAIQEQAPPEQAPPEQGPPAKRHDSKTFAEALPRISDSAFGFLTIIGQPSEQYRSGCGARHHTVFKALDLPRRSDIEALNENLERVAAALEKLDDGREDSTPPHGDPLRRARAED